MSGILKFITLVLINLCLVITIPVIAQDVNQEVPEITPEITPEEVQDNRIKLPDFSVHDQPILTNIFDSHKHKAPVTLDGRIIFEVGEFINGDNSRTADERAGAIKRQLEDAVKKNLPPLITIEKINGSPTISLNDSYLFTVTQQETDESRTIDEKAIDLKQKINQSILEAQTERKDSYQYRQYGIAAIIVALAVTLTRILNLLQVYSWSKAVVKLFKFKQTNQALNEARIDFLTKLVVTTGKVAIWLGAIYWVLDLFPQSRQVRYQVLSSVWNTLSAPLFSNYSIISILIFGLFFWFLLYLTSNLAQALKKSVLNRTSMSRGSREVIFIVTQYGLLAVGTIILLQLWGLDLSSLTILGSALGVGIGFGFQDIAKNFASGLVLLFERSVQVGDFIEVNGHQGTVERVGARSIVLRTLDRLSIIVPNSSLLADEVVNWTHEGSVSRVHIPLGVAYGSDTKQVKSVLLSAAEVNDNVLSYPPAQVFFTDFGDSSLNFQLLVWISEPSQQASIKSELYFAIEELLRKNNINIPFPQRDINLRHSDLGFNLSPNLESALLDLLKKNK